MDEIMRNSFIMPRKAFCGNGFIHLNIAEIHEEHIGGRETWALIVDQGSKGASSSLRALDPMKKI